MATILVPPSQLPPRTIRSIRRAIPHPIHTVSLEQWHSETTHVIIANPIPCLALVCAIASAGRVALVKPTFLQALSEQSNESIASLTEIHHYAVSDGVLEPDTTLLWVGRISLGAYAFWKQLPSKKRPLWKNEVLLVGELRPRGAAASAAPSTVALRHILVTSGATVVSDLHKSVSFAIVAPGLSPSNSTLVQDIVDNNILCFGPAFVIDLLVRLEADPTHYVLFDSQKALCNHKFTSSTLTNMEYPLCVSAAAHKQRPGTSKCAAHSNKAATPQHTDSKTSLITRSAQPANSTHIKTESETSIANVVCEEQGMNSSAHKAHIASKRDNAKRSNTSVASNVRKSARLEAKRSKLRPSNTGEEKPISAVTHESSRARNPSVSRDVTLRNNRKKPSQPSTRKEKESGVKPNSSKTKRPRPKMAKRTSVEEKNHVQVTFEGGKLDKRISRMRENRANDGLVLKEVDTGLKGSPKSDREKCSAEEQAPTLGGKPRVQEKKNDTFTSAISPITPLARGDSRKRHEENSQVCRSSSSEEEMQIIRRAKRARTSDSTSRMKENQSQRESDHITIATQDAVQALNFEEPEVISDMAFGEHLPKRRNLTEISSQSKYCDTTPMPLGAAWESRAFEEPVTTEQVADLPSRDTPRKIKSKWDFDSDIEADADTHTAVEGSASDARDANHGTRQSIDRGFEMFLHRMGGAPDKDIRHLIETQGGKDVFDGDDKEQGHEGEEHQDKELHGRDVGEHSPVLEEEDGLEFMDGADADNYVWRDPGEKDLLSQYVQSSAAGNTGGLREKHGEFEALQIPLPSGPIFFEPVIAPELSIPQQAGCLPKTAGNRADDLLCESKIDATEWILGAENFIGGHGVLDESAFRASTSFRQIWLALFESQVLGSLAVAGGLSESETRVVAGICVRLLACDRDLDVLSVLVKELVDLRETQLRAGYDSISVFLRAKGGSTVPFRHRAIVSIWTTAIQRAASVDGYSAAWSVINKALDSWFGELLAENKSKSYKTENERDKPLVSFVSCLKAIGAMFAVRPNAPNKASDGDGDEQVVRTENWTAVCNVLKRLSEAVAMERDVHRSESMLKSFIKLFTVHISGRLWAVNEEILYATTKAISIAASSRNQSCYCAKAPMVASRFASITRDADGIDVGKELTTPCECLLLLGWLYAQLKDGNVMKRAMNVVKNGALFTNVKANTSASCSYAVNHHVGLLLTMADRLSSTSKNGEYLLCRMLTSKCPSLQSVAEHVARNGGENDLGWNAIMEGIRIRCKVVLAQGKDVGVYVEWLLQNVVNNLMVMRKCGDRRWATNVSREVLRVQDSMFCSFAMKSFEIVADVSAELRWKMQDGGEDGLQNGMMAYQKWCMHVENVGKFGVDVVGQMEAQRHECTAKKRHVVLGGVLQVIEQVLRLGIEMREAWCKRRQERDARRLESWQQCMSAWTTNKEVVETLVVGVMRMKCESEEQQWSVAVKQRASTMVALLNCTLWLDEGEGEGGSVQHATVERAVRLIRQCGLQLVGCEREPKVVDERMAMRMWCEGLCQHWARKAIISERDSCAAYVCCTIWAYVSAHEDWHSDELELLRALAEHGTKVPLVAPVASALCTQLTHMSAPWQDVDEDGLSVSARGVHMALQAATRVLAVQHTHRLLDGTAWRCARRARSRRRGDAREALTILSACMKARAAADRNILSTAPSSTRAATWVRDWLRETAEIATRARNARDGGGSLAAAQRWVCEALGMTARVTDVETALLFARFVRALGEHDQLRGVWTATGAREWARLALHGAVEELLLRGEQRAQAAARRRLRAACAARVPDALALARRVARCGEA